MRAAPAQRRNPPAAGTAAAAPAFAPSRIPGRGLRPRATRATTGTSQPVARRIRWSMRHVLLDGPLTLNGPLAS